MIKPVASFDFTYVRCVCTTRSVIGSMLLPTFSSARLLAVPCTEGSRSLRSRIVAWIVPIFRLLLLNTAMGLTIWEATYISDYDETIATCVYDSPMDLILVRDIFILSLLILNFIQCCKDISKHTVTSAICLGLAAMTRAAAIIADMRISGGVLRISTVNELYSVFFIGYGIFAELNIFLSKILPKSTEAKRQRNTESVL